MLRLQQTAKPALLIAPTLARPLLALFRFVRALRNGSHTLAPTRRAIPARARIRRPAGAFDSPEDFLATHGDSAGGGAVAADARHAGYFADLVCPAIDDLDGLERFVLVHGAAGVCSGCLMQ